ncbi:MAG: cysteine peptidase family C39 domain-containing protein, partial [Halioglobus sp.]
MVIDSGLHCLALVAQLHQVAVDPAALQHRFGQVNAESPVEELLRAARVLGFRAKHLPACELAGMRRTLPAIILARDGNF